jgi:hypothetical protein
VLSAVADLQQGLRYAVLENQTVTGDVQIGTFCVIVDDGTGFPPAALLTEAQAAVNAVRPVGSIFTVNGPDVVQVAVDVVLETSNPRTHAAVAVLVQQNIAAWIAALPIAGILAISKIEAISHDTDPSVLSVTSALINNAAIDILAPANAVILASSVVVN